MLVVREFFTWAIFTSPFPPKFFVETEIPVILMIKPHPLNSHLEYSYILGSVYIFFPAILSDSAAREIYQEYSATRR